MKRSENSPAPNDNHVAKEWAVGPLGERLTLDDLPAVGPQRWHPRRKAEVVAAVAGGLLTMDAACARYELTLEEYASWQRGVERDGLRGLKATGVQRYRRAEVRDLRVSEPEPA